MNQEENIRQIHVHRLMEKGLKGYNTKIGVVNSGMGHDMFAGENVIGEIDFTGEGPYDLIGHGAIITRILHSIAPEAKMISAKVVGANAQANDYDVIRGIQYCLSFDVDLINISLGVLSACEGSCYLCGAAEEAVKRGVVVVAAVGNYGTQGTCCPANAPEVISVGSIEGNNPPGYSSRGKVTVLAPGALAIGEYRYIGTSMATPYVTASLALIFSHLKPDVEILLETLKESATDLGLACDTQGSGLFNAYQLYKKLGGR